MLQENPRMIELRLALILNNVANLTDRVQVNNVLRLLKAVALVENRNYSEPFDNILINSIHEKLLGADKKELCLMLQTYYESSQQYATKLKVSLPTLPSAFLNVKEYITREYLESLTPKYSMLSNYNNMCKVVSDFTDNFRFIKKTPKHPYSTNSRFLELKIWYIFMCLKSYYKSEEKARNLVAEVCNNVGIKSAPLLDVVTNTQAILRGFESRITDNKKLVKEITNFGYLEGLNRSEVASKLLGRVRTYLMNKSAMKFIGADETKNPDYFNKDYVPTVIIDDYYRAECIRFVQVFDHFIADEY